MLHLTAALFKLRGLSPLLCLYVTDDPFPEVIQLCYIKMINVRLLINFISFQMDEFVDKATHYYDIKLIRKKKPIKSAVECLLEENKQLKATLMGIRKDDPGSESLEPFKTTDEGWPKIMRVSPILDWSYSQIWEFILKHKVPYCSLYDQGYTSLGHRTTTSPNPLLRDPDNPARYLPAYTLKDSSTERNGRQ